MEVPTKYLSAWSPLCQLDFVLAHKVLEDEEYARFFRNRPAGRELILDNSVHELGETLPVKDLVRAAELCRADTVIAPDRLGDAVFNLQQYHLMCSYFPTMMIGVVLAGKDRQQRRAFLSEVANCGMICLPFKEDRWTWYNENREQIHRFYRQHLLGVNTLSELRLFNAVVSSQQRIFGTHIVNWSMDTTKALKWGIDYQMIDRLKSVRGGRHAKAWLEFDDELSPAQHEFIQHNVGVLRACCR